MKKRIAAKKNTAKKRNARRLSLLCWMVIPVGVVALLVLDGLGLYRFTTERLIVLGIGLLMLLLPFFSEITVKNFSVKREQNPDE